MTDITLGLQGVSGIEFAYKDMVRNDNSFKRKTYLLQIQNQSKYLARIIHKERQCIN